MALELGPALTEWGQDLWTEFGFIPIALGVLCVLSGRIGHAIGASRFGPIASESPWRRGGVALALVPVALWSISLYAAHAWPGAFLSAVAEDGWIEDLQLLLLFGGAALAGWIARGCFARLLRFWGAGYLLLALALFWAAGEETSWGQRLFGFQTPAWFDAHNIQHETNFHNLGDFDDQLSMLTDIALGVLIVVSAGAGMSGLRGARRLHAALWAPDPRLIPAMLCVMSYGPMLQLYELTRPEAPEIPEALSQLQETRELILYGAMCMFLVPALRHVRALPTASRPSQGRAGGVR